MDDSISLLNPHVHVCEAPQKCFHFDGMWGVDDQRLATAFPSVAACCRREAEHRDRLGHVR